MPAAPAGETESDRQQAEADAQYHVGRLASILAVEEPLRTIRAAVHGHLQQLGIDDPHQCANLIGNTVMALEYPVQNYLAGGRSADELRDRLDTLREQAPQEKHKALKKPGERITADNRFPAGAIDYYKKIWGKETDSTKPFTTSYGAQLTTQDIEHAITADLRRVAVTAAFSVTKLPTKRGSGNLAGSDGVVSRS
jgi:hypothetical protein